MKKEDLVEIGLTDEQVETIFKMRGKEIEAEKLKLSELNSVKESLEQARDKALSDLEELKNVKIDKDEYDKLKDSNKELNKEIKTLKENHLKDIDTIKFDHILDSEISKAGVLDNSFSFVKSVLNKESLEFKDGKVSGLSEELERVKGEHANLFNSGGSGFNYTTKHNSGGTRTSNDAFAAAAEKYK